MEKLNKSKMYIIHYGPYSATLSPYKNFHRETLTICVLKSVLTPHLLSTINFRRKNSLKLQIFHENIKNGANFKVLPQQNIAENDRRFWKISEQRY